MGLLLEVTELSTYFYTDDGPVRAVEGTDLAVRAGEIFGLVGESGSGKTVTALSILRLVAPPGRIVHGDVRFRGRSLMHLSEPEMSLLRGSDLAYVFQNPQASLNPVFTVGGQVAEVFQIHGGLRYDQARPRALEMLDKVGLPDPHRFTRAYPHELSGGQAQRVMIAMALAMEPHLLIADEATAALDVTVQAQILELIREQARDRGTSVILITHDLGVIAEMADRVAVMYAGHIVEQAPVWDLFASPLHPYTRALMNAMPTRGKPGERLADIPGAIPDPRHRPAGCRFAARCQPRIDYELEICSRQEPDLLEDSREHGVRCFLYQSSPHHQAPLARSQPREGSE